MFQELKNKLTILWRNIQQEFQNAPVKSSLAAVGLCTIIFQLLTALWATVAPSNPVIRFLSITTENNLLLIALSLGLLALSFITLRNKPKSKNAVRYFPTIDYPFENLIFTATEHPNGHISIEKIRCARHKYMLNHESYSHQCPEFRNNNCNLKLSDTELDRKKRIVLPYIEKQFRDDEAKS